MSGLTHILLYVRDMAAVIDFYKRLFDYKAHQIEGDRIVELRPADTGAILLLHQAAKGQKQGQAQTKLVFRVPDVDAFCTRHPEFGKIHNADGYQFANTKDPAGNSVQVTTRP